MLFCWPFWFYFHKSVIRSTQRTYEWEINSIKKSTYEVAVNDIVQVVSRQCGLDNLSLDGDGLSGLILLLLDGKELERQVLDPGVRDGQKLRHNGLHLDILLLRSNELSCCNLTKLLAVNVHSVKDARSVYPSDLVDSLGLSQGLSQGLSLSLVLGLVLALVLGLSLVLCLGLSLVLGLSLALSLVLGLSLVLLQDG